MVARQTSAHLKVIAGLGFQELEFLERANRPFIHRVLVEPSAKALNKMP